MSSGDGTELVRKSCEIDSYEQRRWKGSWPWNEWKTYRYFWVHWAARRGGNASGRTKKKHPMEEKETEAR